jgi:hypothetical protein
MAIDRAPKALCAKRSARRVAACPKEPATREYRLNAPMVLLPLLSGSDSEDPIPC